MLQRWSAVFQAGFMSSRYLRCVIRGLDPRIHPSSQEAFFEKDGLPGQARQ
jgi:hypothetical protein